MTSKEHSIELILTLAIVLWRRILLPTRIRSHDLIVAILQIHLKLLYSPIFTECSSQLRPKGVSLRLFDQALEKDLKVLREPPLTLQRSPETRYLHHFRDVLALPHEFRFHSI